MPFTNAKGTTTHAKPLSKEELDRIFNGRAAEIVASALLETEIRAVVRGLDAADGAIADGDEVNLEYEAALDRGDEEVPKEALKWKDALRRTLTLLKKAAEQLPPISNRVAFHDRRLVARKAAIARQLVYDIMVTRKRIVKLCQTTAVVGGHAASCVINPDGTMSFLSAMSDQSIDDGCEIVDQLTLAMHGLKPSPWSPRPMPSSTVASPPSSPPPSPGQPYPVPDDLEAAD